MIRFKCIHCGGRIAVPDDHTDRLARCPDCGGVTHPLAEHLAAPKSAEAAKPEAAKAQMPPSCSNCGGPLGKLQKPFEWDGQLVCGPCHRMLTLDHVPSAEPVPVQTQAVVIREATSTAVVDPRAGKKPLPSEFALYVRTGIIGLIVAAGALYLIVFILQSLGYVFMWAAGAAVIVAVIYWIRRGVLAIRRRAGIRKIVDG